MAGIPKFCVKLVGRKHEIRVGFGCRGCDLGYCMPQPLQKMLKSVCPAIHPKA
jgi:hypothetical protein